MSSSLIFFLRTKFADPNTALSPQFCRGNFIKYAPWTAADIPSILDDDKITWKWEVFQPSCSEDLRQYLAMDVDLRKRLANAEETIKREEE